MGPIALLLAGDPHADDARALQAMLDFFEVPWRSVTSAQVRQGSVAALVGDHSRYALLASAEALAELGDAGRQVQRLYSSASSVYVYGWKPTGACRGLLREIASDPEAEIRTLEAQSLRVSLADGLEEICGPLSGLTLELAPGAAGTALVLRPQAAHFRPIASAAEGYLFAACEAAGTRFFLDASPAILSIRQLSASPFDVKKSFSGAVATVMYLRSEFHDIWWSTPELNACLIIDDLLLKERHGCFRYQELLRLIDRHGIAATVAFIPWNWRRRQEKVVEAMRSNAARMSVCIHGCDHGPAEFAVRSPAWLDARVKTGQRRMRSLLAETGIHPDRVQVFPQGKFCPEAGAALKRNGLMAAVNTEPAPHDRDLNCTTIADQWSVANLRYEGFPIFSRRNIDCGVENFAFDGLLGKPCLIGGHHDLFHGHSAELIRFLERLHALPWKLNWRTVAQAVCRSYQVKKCGETTMVRMYAEQLILENPAERARTFTLLKRVDDLAGFQGMAIEGRACAYACVNGQIQCTVQVPARSQIRVRCDYVGEKYFPAPDPLFYRTRIALLRYLSVFRDGWVSRLGLVRRSAVAGAALAPAVERGPKALQIFH